MKRPQTYRYAPVLFVSVWLLLAYFSTTAVVIWQQRQEYRAYAQDARDRVATLRGERETLKNELTYKASDAFVEREARNRLGLVKPNETVVIFPIGQGEALGQQDSRSPGGVQQPTDTRGGHLVDWLALLMGR